MTTAANCALQRSIYQALTASPELMSLLGGAHIYVKPPQGAAFPYVTIGQTVNLDWSTGSEDGTEHSLTLHVWSRDGNTQEVYEIIQVIRMVLHNQALLLEDHYLVNLRHEFTEARLDPDGETMHGIVRYRAVTEPAQAAAA